MPFTSRRLGGKSKSVWASVMAAAVTAALGGMNRHAQAVTPILTWDSDANSGNGITEGGGAWISAAQSNPVSNWFSLSTGTDVTWPGANNTTLSTAAIAVFGNGGTFGAGGLQVVLNDGGVTKADDKVVAGLTFNPVTPQTVTTVSATWGTNTNILTLSTLVNVRPGEAISGTGIPAGSVVLAINTANNTATINKVTTGAGSAAAVTTTAGYIIAGNRWIAPALLATTITLGAGTDTILDNGFTGYVGASTNGTSLDGQFIADSNFSGAPGNMTGVGNVLMAGAGTLAFPGFQGLNASLPSAFTGTLIFAGGGATTINNLTTSSAPTLSIANGTVIFAKTGTGNAVASNSIILLNGPSAKLQLAAISNNAAGQIADNSTLTLSAGELDLNNNANETIGLLTDGGSSAGIIDNTIAGTSATLTINGNGAATFGGIIRNTGGVVGIGKTGGGSLVLTNANTFTGPLIANTVLTAGTTANPLGGIVILSGTASAANATAQIVGGLIEIDDSTLNNSDITRLGNVLISSNSPTNADGLQIRGNTGTIDRVGNITINTSTSALGAASGVAGINLALGTSTPYTLVANSVNQGANGIGVLTINDGSNGGLLGQGIYFKSNTTPAGIINGIIPWGYVPNSGFFLGYDNTNGFILAQNNATGILSDGVPVNAAQDVTGGLGLSPVTTSAANSIFSTGAGQSTITIGNTLTVVAGAIAQQTGGTLSILGGTLSLPNGGYIYADGGSVINLATDIKSSGKIQLVQATGGNPNANFILSTANPDFTGTLFWGGVNGGPNLTGGPTLTLSNLDALKFATLDSSLQALPPANGATSTQPSFGQPKLILTTNVNATVHQLYNIGAIQGTGQIIISQNSAPTNITSLEVGWNNLNTTFTGQLISSSGGNGNAGGLGADYVVKTGTGTWTLAGNADNAGTNIKVIQGAIVLAKASAGNVHAAANLWIAGGTAIMGGTGDEQTYDGGGTLILDSGTFDLNGHNDTISNFTGAGGIVTNNGTGLGFLSLRPTAAGNNANFSGSFNDGTSPIGLVIGGTGTANLVLSGISNYTGPTVVNTNSTLTVLNTTNMGALTIYSTQNTATNLLVVNAPLNVNGAFSFSASNNSLTNLSITGTGSMAINGSLIGAVNSSNVMIAGQTITWAGPGTFGINGANSPFSGSLTLTSGNLSMNGGTASNSALTTLTGISGGIIFSNNAGGSLNRLTNVVFGGTGNFITANGGATATTDNITGTVTIGGAAQINVLSGVGSETLSINRLSLLPGGTLKFNTNGVLGGNDRVLIGNGTTFVSSGIVPGAVAGSGNTFLGLVTYDATVGIELATANTSQIVDGATNAAGIFSGSLDSAANPFVTAASVPEGHNTLPTTIGAVINTANNAVFSLGNTLTLATGALASSAANFSINDVSGTGIGVLNFGSQQGSIFPAGGGTVTLNAPMIGTNGLALVTATNLGTDFVVTSANNVGGYTTLGTSDTLTLSNQLALANSAVVLPGPGGALVFSGATAYTLGGLGGGLSVALTNTATAPVTLFVGAGSVNTTYAGNLSGTGGSLVKIGNTVMSLDYQQGAKNGTYTGGTAVSGGTLALTDLPQTNNTLVNTFGTGAITLATGGTFDVKTGNNTNNFYLPNNVNLSGGTLLDESTNIHLANNNPNATAQTLGTISVAAGANGNLETTVSGQDIFLDGVLNLPVNSSLTILANGTASQGATHFSNTSNASILGTIIINGTSNNGGRILVDAAPALANATLFVAGGTNNSTFFVAGSSVGALTGTGIVQLSTSGNGAVTVSEGGLASSTFSGSLTGGGTLLKVGNTTLTLTNNIADNISVGGGQVVFNGSGNEAGTLTVTSFGTSVFDSSNSTLSSITRVNTLNLGQFTQTTPALTILGNTGTVSTTVVVSNAISATSGIATVNLVRGTGTGTLTLQTTALTHNPGVLNVQTDGALGTNALLKVLNFTNNSSSGLTLIGPATYATINTAATNAPVVPYVLVNKQGFASYDPAGKFITLAGSTNTIVDGDTTSLNNFAGNAGGIVLNATTSVNSFFNTGSSAVFTINNVFNVGSGGIATTQDLTIGGTGTITSSGALVGTATLAATNNEMVFINDGHNEIINAVIGGGSTSPTVNGLSLIGSAGATFTLGAANTYKGITNVNDAVLVLANPLALQFSTFNNTAANNGTLSFGTVTNPILGGLSGDAGSVFTIPTGVNLGLGNNGQTTTFGGFINGGGSFNKVGAGTITFDQLNQNNNSLLTTLSYTGVTTVTGGMMQVSNMPVEGNPLIGSGKMYYVSGGANGTLNLTGGGTYFTNGNGNSSLNGFIPTVMFNGGIYANVEGIAHVGTDTAGNLYNVSVLSGGGTIQPTWNNKSIVVDGNLTGSGVLSVANRGGGSNLVGVLFTNPNNPFNGVLQEVVGAGNNAGNQTQIAIANPGSVGNSLANAVINLNASVSNSNGLAAFTSTSTATGLSPLANSIGGSNALVFDSTIYTSAVISGLEGVGNFALQSQAASNNGLVLNINTNSLSNATASYTGVMSGAGSLSIGGTGTMTLGGASTYAGNTTLAGGVLALASLKPLTGTGGGIVFNGGTLQLAPGVTGLGNLDDLTAKIQTTGTSNVNIDTNGQTLVWAGSLTSGVFGLNKLGLGTLSLGKTLFTGTTTVTKGRLIDGAMSGGANILSGGELTPGGASATVTGAVHVFGGGALNMSDGQINIYTLSSSLTLDSSAALGFDLGAGGSSDTINLGGALSATGAVVNITLAENQTPATQSSYTLLTSSNSVNVGNFSVGSVPSGFSVTLSSGGNTLLANATYVAPFATFWSGASSNLWTGAGNWASDITGTPANATPGILSTVTFSTNTVGAGPVNTTLGSNTSVASITFQGAQTVFIGGSNTLTLANGTGLTLLNGAGSATINTTGKLLLGADQVWENDSATSVLTVASSIGGTAALTLGTPAGIGTIVLNGSNTYTNGTTIINGIVQTGNVGALAGGSLSITGGTLDIHGTNAVAGKLAGTGGVITNLGATAAALTVNTGGTANSTTFSGTISDGTATTALSVQGNGSLVLTGLVSATGNFSQGASVLQFGDGTTANNFGGNDAVTGGTLSFNPGAAGSSTFSGVLSGTGLLQSSSGHLTVSNSNNSYTGGTNINAGTLSLGANNALGNSGGLNLAAGAFLDMHGFNASVGQLTNGGVGTVTNFGTGLSNLTLTTPANVNNTVNAVFQDGASGKVGVIVNAGAASANGTVTLAAFNTAGNTNFTGGLTVNTGWAFLGSSLPANVVDQLLPDSATVTLNGGFIFETNAAGFDSGQYFIPNIAFNGGGVTAQEGTLHVGVNSNGTTTPILVTANTTLQGTYNNKNLAVDGLLQGTTGTLTISLRNNGAFDSGVNFTNPANTFSGMVMATPSSNGQAAVIAIANQGVSGTALQFATINLNGLMNGTVGNALSLPLIGASSWSPVLPNPSTVGFATNDPRYQSLLNFNSTQMTSAIIAGLIGTGNFALLNTYTNGDASLTLTINQTAGLDSYSGVMSGTGGIVKDGAGGTLALGGGNTFTGGAVAKAGQLLLQNSSALQSAIVSTTGGTIAFDKAPAGQKGIFVFGQLTGAGAISLLDNATTPAGIEVRVGANGSNSTFSGVLSGAGSITQIGTGNMLLTGATNISGAASAAAGSLEFGGSGVTHNVGAVSIASTLSVDAGTTLVSNGVKSTGNWNVNGSQQIRANGSAAGASVVSSLTLAGTTNAWTGKLDITNNLLVVEATPANKAAQLTQLFNQVANGVPGTVGIVSTTLTTSTAIAVVDNGTLGTFQKLTTFRSQPVDANSIFVVQALKGDTNLDGSVNAADLLNLLKHYNTADTAWNDGNSTYNASVGSADLLNLLKNYNTSTGGFSLAAGGSGAGLAPAGNGGGGSSSPVPEPASLAVLALGGGALLARRRRQR